MSAPTFHPSHSAVTSRLRSAGCVFAEDEARLLIDAAHTPEELDRMVDQRVSGLPLEHLLGWAEFCGQHLAVDPGVFVPRRRTEYLAQEAARIARPGAVVVDLCCGSGAVGAAVAAAVGGVELHAADVDPVAVRCAAHNVGPAGGEVHEGDLYSALPVSLRGRVDVLVANAPYVPTDAIRMMPPEARLYEPLMALDGGADGLDVQRRIAGEAPLWLAPGGNLLIETSVRQAPTTAALFELAGLTAKVVHSDQFDATVVLGKLQESHRK
ncbi:putative protein N(5)-glutamine methyltransferase [Arthrobacter sp. MI7-26]|uniref:putative protein N(5)-glutamine methyltransferase n=1 Tax=Arthrobacter sp. MI7-26 TaxID=2993653 RepID=UPI002248AD54|nr:putative protein N(5)-glutamine methyltransferase [Arthrobacter sp. MI7-26]MCX2749128.1 putative protein N(5)-glutamine methyltransferase [Arthrobacter sp. MI7-26]